MGPRRLRGGEGAASPGLLQKKLLLRLPQGSWGRSLGGLGLQAARATPTYANSPAPVPSCAAQPALLFDSRESPKWAPLAQCFLLLLIAIKSISK